MAQIMAYLCDQCGHISVAEFEQKVEVKLRSKAGVLMQDLYYDLCSDLCAKAFLDKINNKGEHNDIPG